MTKSRTESRTENGFIVTYNSSKTYDDVELIEDKFDLAKFNELSHTLANLLGKPVNLTYLNDSGRIDNKLNDDNNIISLSLTKNGHTHDFNMSYGEFAKLIGVAVEFLNESRKIKF